MTVSHPATGPGVRADHGLAEVVEQLTARLKAGEAVDLDACLAAHPEHADELRRLFPALQLLADASRSPSPALSRPAPAGPEAGEIFGQLGDFRLIREVGRGGMGVVYEAEQLSLNRRVALKVLPFAGALDARQLQRFKNEAQAAAHLQHQHIVPVYYVGAERGVHFYAMQFIEGQTLAQLIHDLRERAATGGTRAGHGVADPEQTTVYQGDASRPAAAAWATVHDLPARAEMPPPSPPPGSSGRDRHFFRRAARLGVQAAEALEHAHQMGVIHRDIKPGNLLVDGRGDLWVTDFGLAQVQTDAKLTMTGDLVGTLRYMSPEQALAKRVVIDHRTDVYSLGVTLYELLTLEPAFGGTDRQELLRQIAFQEPRPPRRLNPAVPSELETVVLKAMAKEPAERYATAQELADDLERFLKDEPIRARRPTVLQRLRKWARRHRPVVGSAAVMLLIVLTVVAASVGWTAHDVAERRARAQHEARDQAEKDIEALVKEVVWLQDQGKPIEALAASRRAEARATGGDVSPQRREQVAQLRKDADMVLELEDIRLDAGWRRYGSKSGRYLAAFEHYGIPLTTLTVEEAAGRIKGSAIRSQLVVALDHWWITTIPLFTGVWVRRDVVSLTAIAQLADADPRRREMRDAWQKQNMAAFQGLANDPAVLDQPAATLDVLATRLEARSTEAAVALLRQAQRRYPDDLWLNYHLAERLKLMRPPRGDEAIGFCRAALARRPQSAALRLALGAALSFQGKLAEAEAEYRALILLQPTLPDAHNRLGVVLKRQGRLGEAEVAFRTAIGFAAGGGVSGFMVGVVAQEDLAQTLAMQGKWRRAADAFALVLELTPKEMYQSAVLLLHLGDVQGYRRACREMLRLYGDTGDGDAAERTANTCALAHGAVRDLGPVVRLADRAVWKQGFKRGARLAKGMVEYRTGRFRDAVAWLNRVVPRAGGDSLDAAAFAVLALAHHRLCQADEARAALTKAQAILAHKMPRPEKGQHFGADWHDWLRSQILGREAEQRLGHQASR
jgi:serine/threonine protein kinase/Flp pilus assembly protein TadD